MARIHDSNYQVARDLREVTDRVIIFLSGGKDSIATLALLKELDFQIFAAKYGSLPMEFQERYMRYLERRYKFETHYYPHPDVARGLKLGRYTLPQDVAELDFTLLEHVTREDSGFDWIVGGEKMVDSLHRRGMIHKCKGIDLNRRRAFPLADWNDRDTFSYMKRRRLMIPPDYRLFGSSFQGTTRPANLQKIRDEYPADFQTIRAVFPLADAGAIKQDMLDRLEETDE